MSPDIFRWGGGLPRARVGAKKFGMSLETKEIKLFGRDIPGFCWDIPAAPEKFEKKKFVFNFWPLISSCVSPAFEREHPVSSESKCHLRVLIFLRSAPPI